MRHALNGVGNIKSVLGQSDVVDWEEGLQAYSRYHETMRRLGEHYGYSLETVAAVFAALSPNNDYIKNLKSTVTLLKAHRDRADVNSVTVSTYNRCKFRAWRVLEGERFLEFTKGPKTRNFYLSIVNPQDPEAVTIDGHMLNIWHGELKTMVQQASRSFRYFEVAGDIRQVAFAEFILPSQLQSILWFTWKRINRIVYDGQMDLFRSGDHWRLLWDPADIGDYYSRRSADQ
jgi:hypothetical protein